MARWRGEILVADAESRGVVRIARGVVRAVAPTGRKPTHAIRGGAGLARLLLGSDEPLEVAAEQGIRLTGEAKKVLPALFPRQYPTLGSWDRY